MKKIIGLLILAATPVFGQVGPMCVPCQTCKDILADGTKIDMVEGVFRYEWDFPCGTVYGTLSSDRKNITIGVPECCKVKICRKAGTDCDTSEWLSCGQDGTYGVSNGKELSHVSIQAQACCQSPTPTPTKTPPPPTPTPTKTPPPPTPTPTGTPPPTPTPPPPCDPDTECRGRCGLLSDGCNGAIDCGPCAPPEPTPNCYYCAFPARYMAETGEFYLERLYFPRGGVVQLLLLEGTQSRVYNVVYWKGNADGSLPREEVLIHRFNGPGNVEIPVPSAGLAIPVGSYIEVYGGKSRVTVWLQNPDTPIEVQHFNRTWMFSLVRSHR